MFQCFKFKESTKAGQRNKRPEPQTYLQDQQPLLQQLLAHGKRIEELSALNSPQTPSEIISASSKRNVDSLVRMMPRRPSEPTITLSRRPSDIIAIEAKRRPSDPTISLTRCPSEAGPPDAPVKQSEAAMMSTPRRLFDLSAQFTWQGSGRDEHVPAASPSPKSDINNQMPTPKSDIDMQMPTPKSDIDVQIPTPKSDMDILIPTPTSDMNVLMQSPTLDMDAQMPTPINSASTKNDYLSRIAPPSYDAHRKLTLVADGKSFSLSRVISSSRDVHQAAAVGGKQDWQARMLLLSSDEVKQHSLPRVLPSSGDTNHTLTGKRQDLQAKVLPYSNNIYSASTATAKRPRRGPLPPLPEIMISDLEAIRLSDPSDPVKGNISVCSPISISTPVTASSSSSVKRNSKFTSLYSVWQGNDVEDTFNTFACEEDGKKVTKGDAEYKSAGHGRKDSVLQDSSEASSEKLDSDKGICSKPSPPLISELSPKAFSSAEIIHFNSVSLMHPLPSSSSVPTQQDFTRRNVNLKKKRSVFVRLDTVMKALVLVYADEDNEDDSDELGSDSHSDVIVGLAGQGKSEDEEFEVHVIDSEAESLFDAVPPPEKKPLDPQPQKLEAIPSASSDKMMSLAFEFGDITAEVDTALCISNESSDSSSFPPDSIMCSSSIRDKN